MKIQVDKLEIDILQNELLTPLASSAKNISDSVDIKFNMLPAVAEVAEVAEANIPTYAKNILEKEYTSEQATTEDEHAPNDAYAEQLYAVSLLLPHTTVFESKINGEKNSLALSNLVNNNSGSNRTSQSSLSIPSSSGMMPPEFNMTAIDNYPDTKSDSQNVVQLQSEEPLTPIDPSSSPSEYLNHLSNSIDNNLSVSDLAFPSADANAHTPMLNQQEANRVFAQLAHFVNNRTTQQPVTSLTDRQANGMLQSDLISMANNQLVEKSMQPEAQLSIETLRHIGKQDHYNAIIKIFPPELGEINAQLKISDHRAELIVLSQNNYVKELIEANLSSLRESFQKMDLPISHIDIFSSAHNNGAHQFNQQKQQLFSQSMNIDAIKEEANINTKRENTSTSDMYLIDTYV